jgi:ubiquinone/menaquinone biosynthesis C-methylase UbiE
MRWAERRQFRTTPRVASVVGVDPAPALLCKARAAAADLTNVRFEDGDGRSLPFEGAMFDIVTWTRR